MRCKQVCGVCKGPLPDVPAFERLTKDVWLHPTAGPVMVAEVCSVECVRAEQISHMPRRYKKHTSDLVPIESGEGTVLPEQPGDRERFFSMTTEQLQAEWEQVRQQALGIMRQAVGGILGGRKATTESERRQLREEVEDVLTMRGVAYAASAIKQLVDDLSRPVNIEQESHLSSALDSCPEHEDCQPDVVLG